jgi:hypothetical protein
MTGPAASIAWSTFAQLRQNELEMSHMQLTSLTYQLRKTWQE